LWLTGAARELGLDPLDVLGRLAAVGRGS